MVKKLERMNNIGYILVKFLPNFAVSSDKNLENKPLEFLKLIEHETLFNAYWKSFINVMVSLYINPT